MSRIVFPKDGIHPHCRDDLEECSRYLTKARVSCSFNIPSSFPYKNYLYNLDDKINEFRREIKSIDSKLKRIDNNFRILSDDLEISANKIDTPKLPKRNRMIV